MLKIITGRAGSGKTAEIYRHINELALSGQDGTVLIVPEQFSHEAERELCRVCGNKISLFAEVLSFSRLSSRVFAQVGGLADRQLDKGGRVLVMSLALSAAAPSLKAYGFAARKPEFLQRLLKTRDEFKTSCAFEDIHRVAESFDGVFSQKLSDLALIFEAYESLIPEGMCDPYDRLDKLSELVEKSDIGNKNIFIDGFTDFTAQELHVIEKLMRKCENMTVCLTCDDILGTENQFEQARITAARLMKCANEQSVKTELVHMERQMGEGQIDHLEKYLFSDEKMPYDGDDNSVFLYLADSAAKECELAASEARRLVRETGCRWRDIAVSASDWSAYSAIAAGVFEKYQVPVYTYDKEDILRKPVLALLTAALDVISGGWAYADVFRYLKTGLAGISKDDRDILENYVYKWNIRGSAVWNRADAWTASPGGFSDTVSDSDKALLERINMVRLAAAAPVYKLEKALSSCIKAGEMVLKIYDFLEDIDLYGSTEKRADELEAAGDNQNAAEYRQLWDILVSALEQCAEILENAEMEQSEFIKLFKLLLSQYEVGTIPANIDSVGIGDMVRMRRRNVKHTIIIGASDDKMPAVTAPDGILTDDEKLRLSEIGLELADTSDSRISRQMNAIYTAMTQPSDTLTVCCRTGESIRPSFVYTGIENLLGIKPKDVGMDIKREALLPCFELAATGDRDAAAYFESDPEWSDRLRFTKEAAAIPRGRLSAASAKGLYSSDINITASRVDKYYSCKFAYFLQYGLRAKPRTKAAFEAPEAGTFMHYVLENVTRDVMAGGGFAKADREKLTYLTDKYVREYIDTVLEGFKDKTKRFVYLFNRLTKDALSIVLSMADELSCSDFVPLDFELDFSRSGDLAPAVVETEGETVTVNGKVDRVDGWIKDGKLYLRVVDYKTGRKEFSLSDVLRGIGLQMLIYLFALQKNGSEKYGKEIVPAGVLYMPAREVMLPMDRSASDSEIEKERVKNLKRKGLILDDSDVIEAMEHGTSPKYIPVKFNKDGDAVGDSLASLEKLGVLSEHIDMLLGKMGSDLRQGEISADPYFKDALDNACLYCDYFEACRFGEDKKDKRRYHTKLKSPDVWDKLSGKEKA